MSEVDPAVERVNALARAARTSWLSLLTFAAFIGVTLLGVEDADFFVPSRQTELPIIGVAIPTNRFFIFAPVLAMALYAHLHFHLMKLWEALAPEDLPPEDAGAPISDRINASFIADLALALRRDAALRPRPLRGVTVGLTGILVFVAPVGVIGAFWWRSMPAKDEALTVLACGLSLSFALLVGANSFAHLWRYTRGGAAPRRFRLLRGSGVAVLFLGVAGLGWMRTEGTLDWYKETWEGWPGQVVDAIPWTGTPYPDFLAKPQMEGVDFIGLPDDWLDYETAREKHRVIWCKDHGVPLAICGEAELDGEELERREAKRLAWCARQYGKEDTAQCVAEFADQTRLRAAAWLDYRRIETATLSSLSLTGKDLRGANLGWARMEGANLFLARLEGAELTGGGLEAVNLIGARLDKAILRGARLESANLVASRFEGADLSLARLQEADLWEAHLEGADLSDVQVDASTVFSPAAMRGARLKDVDFTMLALNPEPFKDVFGDASVNLPNWVSLHPEAPVDRNLRSAEWDTEWRAWQERNGYATE